MPHVATQSPGQGLTISKYTKQNINPRTSTETELLVADDIIPHGMGKSYLLDYLGYKVKVTITYQDSKIEIPMEKNGNNYSSKRGKHTNISYFLSSAASRKFN